MSRLKLPGGYYLGTGLLSVVGTSFATLSTADAVSSVFWSYMHMLIISWLDFRCDVQGRYMSQHHSCRRNCDQRSLPRCFWHGPRNVDCLLVPGNDLIFCTCSHSPTSVPTVGDWLVLCLHRGGCSVKARFIFSGTVVLMIGASLIGSSGIPNWGGGSNDCLSRPTSGLFQLCPDINAPRPLPCVVSCSVSCLVLVLTAAISGGARPNSSVSDSFRS